VVVRHDPQAVAVESAGGLTVSGRPLKFRLYVDEVGNHDLQPSYIHPNDRFLSLTGVMLGLEYVRTDVAVRLEDLKARYFGSHPDDPVTLHRRELVRREPPFHALRGDAIRERFDAELLALLADLDYTVITVVIDKLTHLQRYGRFSAHPYHYCLEVLLERYCFELRDRSGVGDVMAEARGGREDRALKEAFRNLCVGGSLQVDGTFLRRHLTSREIKLRQKRDNIAGLQLADVLAYPSWKGTLLRREGSGLPDDFTGRVVKILESGKYRAGPKGRIDGYGRKWLP
jgi:hypothetical protein